MSRLLFCSTAPLPDGRVKLLLKDEQTGDFKVAWRLN